MRIEKQDVIEILWGSTKAPTPTEKKGERSIEDEINDL